MLRCSDNASLESRDILSATQHAVLHPYCGLFPCLSKIVRAGILICRTRSHLQCITCYLQCIMCLTQKFLMGEMQRMHDTHSG